MDFTLEFIRSVVPAVVVFITVYFLLTRYFEHERFKAGAIQMQSTRDKVLPMKLQAYERLSLFLERIRFENLMFRLPQGDLRKANWITTLMIAVQQEYEHNLVQQIYISEPLWNIIDLARNEVFKGLYALSEIYEHSEDGNDEVGKIIEHTNLTIQKALSAIKQEVGIILAT
ncbi:MAG: hypothetical protein K1X68_09605 [Saprospiraceae bacterium]|nr:hypothetical protein [Saprospiraceae bacterium]HMW39835.1 hypothetical protein [Saprospiraceae bacterium]HMX88809.1 hypothetical protein [Saprospiraceae bacterium]HMZ39093.1 hypothetical protein [Saprospiraceae bacterium]HNA64618.1 hypothetical protein [Saprospiraceae bacterium]